MSSILFRQVIRADDAAAVRRLAESTGFFNAEEVATAVELVEERLRRGPASGYEFVFAERDGVMIAYACFGRVAGTSASFDLYWIVVDAACRGRGIGADVLRAAEVDIAQRGGGRLYVDTSSRSQYDPTRRFYERNGFFEVARLEDFYGPGDAKVIYSKHIPDFRPARAA